MTKPIAFVLFLAVSAASLYGATRVAASATDGNATAAVVFLPWVSSGEAVERTAQAGATVVALGRFPFVVIAASGQRGFAASAFRQGAIFVLDPNGLAGCWTLGA